MLNVFITVKSLGKRKNHLDRLAWLLSEVPLTLKALIIDMVTTNVRQLNERETETPLVPFLTQGDIEQLGQSGKIGFGALYNEKKADEKEAISTAILAFEDGLYRVFINGNEIEQLDDALTLHEGDEIAFVRFTMLAGSTW
ncbi:hypothetical protein [Paenibacillus sp. FJAT-27812]|uniref:hypothetical protein n=1 Tax=Paenibacillus sp. FJAT-27812 TaxID=1684143 RepID=UPI0006A7C1C5|nr:hypothetical protein [Paenibacillus sp. FJAT-27812]